MGGRKKSVIPRRQTTQDTADELSKFFADKVATIRAGLDAAAAACPAVPAPNSGSYSGWNPLLRFNPLSSAEVIRLVDASPTKSCQSDPIPTTIVKQLATTVAQPLTKIVNMSMETGRFPAALKHALVTPLLKKPGLDPDDLANYRPVSNLPFLGKLIERAVHQQLMDHLADNHLLPPRQSAYRPNHSTETALLSIYNDLLLAADQNNASAVAGPERRV